MCDQPLYLYLYPSPPQPPAGAALRPRHVLRRPGMAGAYSGACLSALLLACSGGARAAAPALPAGGTVAAGAAQISQSGDKLTVRQTSQNLALDWRSFNIGEGKTVRFDQPQASSIALNRIVDQNASQILGSLSANGQVFLSNPNGILFGRGARVDVGGLLATSNTISDADVQARTYRFSSGSGNATLINRGTLNAADGGYIVLLGTDIHNEGSIAVRAGAVLLAAGSQITVHLDNGSLIGYTIDKGATRTVVDNQRAISADGGTVTLSAKGDPGPLARAVVNNDGVIEARTINNKAGQIQLLGDMRIGELRLSGVLDASAPHGGAAGAIETSAASVSVAAAAQVSAAASGGRIGSWTVRQPGDLLIAERSTTDSRGGKIAASALARSLNSTNVTVQTGGARTGHGDIVVNDAVTWGGPATLALHAHRDVKLNASLANSGGGSLLLRADEDAGNTGTVKFGPQGKVNLSGGGATALYYNPLSYAAAVDFSASIAGPASVWMLVNDVQHLQNMNTNLAGNYALGANIDAGATAGWNGGAGFAPVGATLATPYSGRFDGLNHRIENLWIQRPASDVVGLFGFASGQIANLALVCGSVTGRQTVGALVGSNQAALSNLASSVNVKGDSYVGGVVGFNRGVLQSVSFNGSASGRSQIGGLAGGNFGPGSIIGSYSAGVVTGTDAMIGGLAGRQLFGTISGSYSGSTVTGVNSVGGLVGYIDIGGVSDSASGGVVRGSYNVGGLVGVGSDSVVNISHASSTATVSGSWAVGGLVGQYTYGTISDAHFSGDVSGGSAVGGVVGSNGQGKLNMTYSSGSVHGLDAGGSVGGLAGSSGGAITNSYSTATVSGRAGASGGLVGENFGTVSTSYSSGKVVAGAGAGGLIGSGDAGAVTNSYWDVNASGQAGSAGGTGLSSGQMVHKASYAGFDFVTVWRINEGHATPQLR